MNGAEKRAPLAERIVALKVMDGVATLPQHKERKKSERKDEEVRVKEQ